MYLADSLHLTTAAEGNRRLHSADLPTLSVTATRRLTVGDWVFHVAAACIQNSLPSALSFAPSLDAFRRQVLVSVVVPLMVVLHCHCWELLANDCLYFYCVKCP
jgi:hypothetical protein